jgi:hypothetical protein
MIDFLDRTQTEAPLYEMPFEYAKEKVKPKRDENRDGLMNRIGGCTRALVRR